MRHHLLFPVVMLLPALACGGGPAVKPGTVEPNTPAAASPPAAEAAPAAPSASPAPPAKEKPADDGFVLRKTDPAAPAAPSKPSKITSTATEAAMKFFVINKEKGPVAGIVVSLTGADGRKFYTEPTDADGYAEVLVPVGQKYDIVYVSLGRRDVAASVTVTNEPKQNIKLTLRYKRFEVPPILAETAPAAPRFILNDITFDTGKATIRPESFARLDSVVEYLVHKKNARLEISGHTDNVGSAKINTTLSEKRAKACLDYLVSKGIEASRLRAVGYGGERPIASNDSEEGRQKNRRIEVMEE